MNTLTQSGSRPNESIVRIGLICGLVIASFVLVWVSVLGGGLLLTISAVILVAPRRRNLTLAALGTAMIVLFTLYKRPEGDEYYYLLYIDRLRGYGFGWLSTDTLFSIRPTEPLFTWYTVAVAAVPYGKLAFIVSLIGIVYYASARSVVAVADRLKANAIPILVFTFLLSINMFGAAQLMRQYLAVSIASIAVVFLLNGRFRWAFAIIFVSSLIHNSNLILLAGALAAMFIERRPRLTMVALLAGTAVAYYYLSREIVTTGATDAERWLASFSKDDGSVPIWLIAADLTILSTLAICWLVKNESDPVLARFLAYALALAGFLAAASGQDLLFLRSYVAIEFIRPIAVMLILKQFNLQRDPVVGFAIMALAFGYFFYRMNNIVFDYGGGVADIFGIGVDDLVARLQGFDLR